jgi:hypothetical protein
MKLCLRQLLFVLLVALPLVSDAQNVKPPSAPARPTLIVRDGKATYEAIDPAKLPAEADKDRFAAQVSGPTFNLYVPGIAAQALTIELGFVDTKSTAAGENTFAVTIDGVLLDPNLDVCSKAGGAFTPFVLKSPVDHKSGNLTIAFDRVKGQAFVSYVLVFDASGKELANGVANRWRNGIRPQKPSLDNCTYPYRAIKVNEQPFYNADHSPVGGSASFVYGMRQSGGVQSWSQGGESGVVPNRGMLVAVQQGKTTRLMPFAMGQSNVPDAEWIKEDEVTRRLGACTDQWQLPLGVSWTHYTPIWQMKDWDSASPDERRRFVLPATCIQFTLDNQKADDELRVLFSLQQDAGNAGDFPGWQGYKVRKHTLLFVKSGDGEMTSADQAEDGFGVTGANSAFIFRTPAHSIKTVMLYVVHYSGDSASTFQGQPIKLMSDALFKDALDVLSAASSNTSAMIEQCQKMDARLSNCGQNAERQFLAAQALHSYQFNTVMYALPDKSPVWAVIEGQYGYINTFDLTVDHLFYELAVHPWTVRNELDNFYRYYSYQDQLALSPDGPQVPGGLGFYHDMGQGTKFASTSDGAAYGRPMTQEELQNWILCGALYWKTTGDNDWLTRNKKTFEDALRSMQLRDDVDPGKRDGITTYISILGQRGGEITTYDAMDASLRDPQNNLYIAVKSFACYSVLQDVFKASGDTDLGEQCRTATDYTAKAIVSHWDANRQMFPATFDGKGGSPVIPAIEGLIYPYVMGRTQDVSETGPYAELVKRLKQHTQTVLAPGICIDRETGGWNLSPNSATTWVSKVFLNQYIAENVLGVRNDTTGGRADTAHVAYEILGAPVVGFSDQIYTDLHTSYAGRHYPRGVTTALWWLSPR